jgi:hypothetical protein
MFYFRRFTLLRFRFIAHVLCISKTHLKNIVYKCTPNFFVGLCQSTTCKFPFWVPEKRSVCTALLLDSSNIKHFTRNRTPQWREKVVEKNKWKSIVTGSSPVIYDPILLLSPPLTITRQRWRVKYLSKGASKSRIISQTLTHRPCKTHFNPLSAPHKFFFNRIRRCCACSL